MSSSRALAEGRVSLDCLLMFKPSKLFVLPIHMVFDVERHDATLGFGASQQLPLLCQARPCVYRLLLV